jgi:protein TonB
VSDAISRLLSERERQDHGLQTTLLVSLTGHFGLAALAVVLPMFLPREPPLKLSESVFVVLPRGGGGTPQQPAPPAPEPVAKPKPEESAAPPPPPVVLKPPPKTEPRPNALPLPDSKTKRSPTPPPVRAVTKPTTTASSGTAGTTPGLEFGPPGPGVPTGTETGGDWYLASVQQKIWILWNQQIRPEFKTPVAIVFTILADGSVTDVKVVQSSGATLLDLAAQRAIYSAAPFGPLPKDYGTNRKTIQASFKPTT